MSVEREAKKRTFIVVVSSIVIIIAFLIFIVALKNHSEGNAQRQMLNDKVAMLNTYTPNTWECISSDGGWNKAHNMYEYTFTFMINGIAGHVTYVYASPQDLTRDTVGLLTRVDDNGFEIEYPEIKEGPYD